MNYRKSIKVTWIGFTSSMDLLVKFGIWILLFISIDINRHHVINSEKKNNEKVSVTNPKKKTTFLSEIIELVEYFWRFNSIFYRNCIACAKSQRWKPFSTSYRSDQKIIQVERISIHGCMFLDMLYYIVSF